MQPTHREAAQSPREPGFTLIEILVVIVVIGILAGIAILHLSPLKDKGYTTTMIEDLRNLEDGGGGVFH